MALTATLLLLGCWGGSDSEIQVTVSRIALDPSSRSPVVVLEDADHSMALPIWIGPTEAQAIAARLEGVDVPRPLTHDLMKNVLDEVGVGLRKVVITDLRDNTYYARIVLDADGDEVAVDARPSDAIALAVRFEQPIYVSRTLMERENVVALRSSDVGALTVDGVTVQPLSAELAGAFDLPHGQGVLVADVGDDAERGLQRGDVILEVDGDPVRDPADYQRKMSARGPRQSDLAVHRDGVRIHVSR